MIAGAVLMFPHDGNAKVVRDQEATRKFLATEQAAVLIGLNALPMPVTDPVEIYTASWRIFEGLQNGVVLQWRKDGALEDRKDKPAWLSMLKLRSATNCRFFQIEPKAPIRAKARRLILADNRLERWVRYG